MRKFRTWKQMQKTFGSLSKKGSLDLFLKEELPDSRSIICEVMNEKSVIDFEIFRSNIPSVIKRRSIDRGNTSTSFLK